jgi:nucleoside diphosphate kinase
MSLDAATIAALISVAGILVAAILSSAGYFYKNYTENKKSSRKVLYLLLELRNVVLSALFDPNEATEKYISHLIQRLKDKGVDAKPEDLQPYLKELIRNHFSNLVDATKTNIHERLLPSFESSLIEMASVDPVLAYQLKGREALEKLIMHTKDYQKNVRKMIDSEVSEDWLKEACIESSSVLGDDALKELTKILDDDVLLLAKSCGWHDFRLCKKVISSSFNNENKYEFDDLDAPLDKFLENITIKANKRESHLEQAGASQRPITE